MTYIKDRLTLSGLVVCFGVLSCGTLQAQKRSSEVYLGTVQGQSSSLRLNDRFLPVQGPLQTEESISDIISDVPGAFLQSGVSQLEFLRIRGAESGHLAVVIDGVEQNSPGVANGAFDFSSVLLSDIESIEIRKGPQSAISGTQGVSGVLYLKTKTGKLTPKTAVSIQSKGDTHQGRSVSANLKVREQNTYFSLWGEHAKSKGQNIALKGAEEDGYEKNSFGFNGGGRVFSAVDLSVQASFLDRQSDTDSDLDFDGVVEDTADFAKQRKVTGALGFKTAFKGPVQAAGKVYALDDKLTSFSDFGVYEYVGRRQGSDLSVSYRFAQDQKVRLDAKFQTEKLLSRYESSFGSGKGDYKASNQSYGLLYQGAFLDRQAKIETAVRKHVFDDFENEFSYQVAVSIEPKGQRLKLHGSYGKGVKTPTFFERYGYVPGLYQGNEDLHSEISYGGDLGFEKSFLKGNLSLGATYFWRRLEDQISGSGQTSQNIKGRSRSQGWEAFFKTKSLFAEGLDFWASYTYTKNKYPKGELVASPPEHEVSLGTRYRFWDKKALVGFKGRYIGARKDLDFGSFPARSVSLKPYWTLSASASYQLSPHARFFVRVDNLLNKKYQPTFGYNGEERKLTLGVNLTY